MSKMSGPADLLREYSHFFTEGELPGPILDLAGGDCHNGIFLAAKGLPVVCCDRAEEALVRAKMIADELGVAIERRQVDLEVEGVNPLPENYYGGIMVFRYLHRPLITCIKKALKAGGILIYETFTVEQPRFGKPHNPDYLLKPGELRGWFNDWEVIYYFEGIKDNPQRAVAQIVCRKAAEKRKT